MVVIRKMRHTLLEERELSCNHFSEIFIGVANKEELNS